MKLHSIIALVLFPLTVLSSLAAEKTYTGQGFTFNYSDTLQLVESGKAVKSIRVKDDKGIQFLVQNYKEMIKPAALSDMMMNALKGRFPGKCEEAAHKGITRTLMGERRDGRLLYIYPQADTLIQCAVFTFTHENNTFCVITQQVMKDTLEAEKLFKTVQDSLKLVKE